MTSLIRTLLLAGLLALIALPAAAGPWVRDKGGLFLSFGGNVALSDAAQRPVHWDPTLYLEYGLMPRVTVGLELYSANGDKEKTGSAFVRLPLRDPGARTPVAVSLAYGMRIDEALGTLDRLARIGLSVGRGLDRGWLAADAAAIYVIDAGRVETKLDLTWGRQLSDRWTGVLQLQTGRGTAGDVYAKIAPSMVLQVSERSRLELGVVQALTGDRGNGIRVGNWWEF